MTVFTPNRIARKLVLYALAVIVVFLMYYGLPATFLKTPVRAHLGSKYGIHIDFEAVRVSLRGLIVTDVSAVWPDANMTMSVREMTLGWSPVKSVIRGKIVFERLKIVYPSITWRMPEMTAPVQPARDVATDTARATAGQSSLRLPESFDLTIRMGRIRLMRGSRAAEIYPFDAEAERQEPGRIRGSLSVESREIGRLDVRYREGSMLEIDADAIQLGLISDLAGSSQHVAGYLSAKVRRDGRDVTGRLSTDQLTWSGVAATAEEPIEFDTMSELVTAETFPVTAVEADSDADTRLPEVLSYISVPLSVELDISRGRWESQTLTLDKARVGLEGVDISAAGSIQLSRRLDAVLEFYAESFDEPAIQSISGHFHVLRYLHAFLETIRSPSRLQAKMRMAGPLSRPSDWIYDGLVDIRRDTFSYGPFLGQYSFLGTIRFDQSGVSIPEIQIPFGSQYLTLSGVAADYRTHQSRMELRGANLDIGPVMQYYSAGAPEFVLPSPQSDPSARPTGAADVNLTLARRNNDPWSLNGSIEFKRLSVPLKIFSLPARAYGSMDFTGDRGIGTIRARVDSFEFELRPFAMDMFTSNATGGVYWSQTGVRWDKMAAAFTPGLVIPYVPTAGAGAVSLKLSAASRDPDPRAEPDSATPSGDENSQQTPDSPASQAGAPTRWSLEGTVEVAGGKFVLPPFSAPVESVSASLSFEDGAILIRRAEGVMGRSRLTATGHSMPGRPRDWSLSFQSPELDLPDLLSMIARTDTQVPKKSFDVSATALVDRLKFRAFEFQNVSGKFNLRPGRFTLAIDTPIRTDYRSIREDRAFTELTFVSDQPYPIKKLFNPAAVSATGNISGTVALRGADFSDSSRMAGRMDLRFDQFAIQRAPALLKLLELTRFSFLDALVFDPFEFHSDIKSGAVTLNFDRMSNAGRWIFRGRLGMDATYLPLTESDSAFHVTFYPRENFVVRLLSESGILNILGGKGEGIVLDFGLVGNYNNANILWTNAPLLSIIRGRVSELVPGIFNAPSQSDTSRLPKKDPGAGAGGSPR